MIVVAAFGQILRQNVLDLPKYGCINVHASLLPRWRGASPVSAAILYGDTETGVTIMQMDAGLDTGPIYAQRTHPIQPDDTSDSLSGQLAKAGADLLLETLPGIFNGSLRPTAQDESLATYTGKARKEDGLLDFQKTACELDRQVRAFYPWPGAFFMWKGLMLKIHQAHEIPGLQGIPGYLTVFQGKPAVYCQEGLLVLDTVHPAGKKAMPGEVFLRGAGDWQHT
jgi:methionyl-tRNA formyltransferase